MVTQFVKRRVRWKTNDRINQYVGIVKKAIMMFIAALVVLMMTATATKQIDRIM